MASTAPFGLWRSPLQASSLAEGVISLADVVTDRSTGGVFHIEGRPAEKGRNVLVESVTSKDATSESINCRTRVHEYGGGAAAARHGKVVLSDFASNAVFQVDKAGNEKRIVPDNSAFRYADFDVHPQNSDLILAVKEDHTIDEPSQVVNTLVLIDASSSSVTTLVEGKDFYAAPRWNNDGTQICWVEWEHPNMPWDGTELFVADISAQGQLSNRKQIAGKQGTESISQPRWALDGHTLLFLSDSSGFYTLYTWSAKRDEVKTLLAPAAKTDLGGPDWVFGQSTYQPLNEDLLIVRTKPMELSLVSLSNGTSDPLDLPIQATYGSIRVANPQLVVAIASPVDSAAKVVAFDPTAAQVVFKTLKTSFEVDLDSKYISVPREISFPAGPDPGEKDKVESFALFYAPKNDDYQAPSGSKPPLIVEVHGGPTASASPSLNLQRQFYTSRGFAIADVNYGGSTGKGRPFRNRLQGNWGVVDTQDCVACVEYLVEQGLVDGSKVIITGQSSGGYSALIALPHHPGVFTAAVSRYGIADLEMLCEFTHKFESHYLFGLIGGTPSEVPQVYRDRAPIHNADKIKDPLLILQGDEDKIVPPAQAEAIVKAVRGHGVRVDYHLYAGEGHGFRQSSSIIDVAERTVAFLIDVLGIKAST